MIRARLRSPFRAALFACAILASCGRGEPGSAAFVDPVFAAAVPESIAAFKSVCDRVVILPEAETSATLYSTLSELKPRLVFLSPLLASEADEIAAAYPEAFIALFGWNAPPVARRSMPKLAEAVFARTGAASVAGRAIASAIQGKPGAHPETVIAVFAGGGRSELSEASAAFADEFAKAGRPSPMVEISQEAFSVEAAKRLSEVDAGFAFVSSPPDAIERWLSTAAIGAGCVAYAELSLPPTEPAGRTDIFVHWDLPGTFAELAGMAARGQAGLVEGKWSLVELESAAGGTR